MKSFLRLLKRMLGPNLTKKIRPLGHGIKTFVAAIRFGIPARKLKIVGITGTKGKTTTTVFTGRLANKLGIKTGYISTSVIYLGDESGEFLNPFKMTSVDGFILHKYLAEMVKNGCEWVVLEMSSQGLEQKRHWGLFGFDIAAFLNITPEHIEAHGTFENYLRAKAILFQNLKSKSSIVVNSQDPNWVKMAKFIHGKPTRVCLEEGRDWKVKSKKGQVFKQVSIEGVTYSTSMIADFDVANLIFAANLLLRMWPEVDITDIGQKFSLIQSVPGRMEWVMEKGVLMWPNKSEKSSKKSAWLNNLSVLVDYAHEPNSMEKLLQTLDQWRKQKIYDKVIHVLSCDGAGRDDWKKPIMGDLSLKYADYTVLTTDNYDEDDTPEQIVKLLSQNYDHKLKGVEFESQVDRRKAFEIALDKATQWAKDKQKVLIVSTGVGSEQGLTRPGGKVEWDERRVWRDLLSKLSI